MNGIIEVLNYSRDRLATVRANGKPNGEFWGARYADCDYLAESRPILDYMSSWQSGVGWVNPPEFSAFRVCQYNTADMTAYVRVVEDEELLSLLGPVFVRRIDPNMALIDMLSQAELEKEKRYNSARNIPYIEAARTLP